MPNDRCECPGIRARLTLNRAPEETGFSHHRSGITNPHHQAVVENINTPGDAVIAEAPVRGPLTMWAQSEAITRYQLDRTEGLRYAEMPRLIEQVDPEAGGVIIGEDGEPVMVSNDVRLSWIDATALTTVLGLGNICYAFSAFAMVVGRALMGLGWVVLKLRRSADQACGSEPV